MARICTTVVPEVVPRSPDCECEQVLGIDAHCAYN